MVWVFGGDYARVGSRVPQVEDFRLVSPTRGKPYQYADETEARSMYRLCSHHSHLYSLEGTTATLVLKSAEAIAAGVKAPRTATVIP